MIRNAVPHGENIGPQSGIGGAPTVGVWPDWFGEKGLDDLLDAAVALRERVPGVRFVLAGNGPLRAALGAPPIAPASP